MSWSTIATLTVTRSWQSTPAVAADLGYVRLSFATAGVPILVAQVDPVSGDMTDLRAINATPQAQILEFQCPPVLGQRAIALRAPSSRAPFEVKVELSTLPIALNTNGGGGTVTVNLQPILDGQSQILQRLEQPLATEFDPVAAARLQFIAANQLHQNAELVQILQQIAQPAEIDPAIFTQLAAIAASQTAQTAVLQQLQTGQTQILQAIASPTSQQYDLITTAYIASQSSAYTAPGSYTTLNDNGGATGATTNNSGDEWIKATFPTAVTVRAVRLGGGAIPGWGGVAAYLNGKVLQYSTDNTNWLTLFAIQGIQDAGPGQFLLFSLGQPITARFWRIQSSGYLATTEFRFFG